MEFPNHRPKQIAVKSSIEKDVIWVMSIWFKMLKIFKIFFGIVLNDIIRKKFFLITVKYSKEFDFSLFENAFVKQILCFINIGALTSKK